MSTLPTPNHQNATLARSYHLDSRQVGTHAGTHDSHEYPEIRVAKGLGTPAALQIDSLHWLPLHHQVSTAQRIGPPLRPQALALALQSIGTLTLQFVSNLSHQDLFMEYPQQRRFDVIP